MPEFSEQEAPVTLSQIEELEHLTGLNFPQEYKEHLLIYNGGKCDPCDFTFVEDGRTTASDVDWFLAIYDGEYDNLLRYITVSKLDEKRLPYHMIPIAHDSGGNLICISCSGPDCGSVYFWDHEIEVDYSIADDSDYSNLYIIAVSFNDFINSLHNFMNE